MCSVFSLSHFSVSDTFCRPYFPSCRSQQPRTPCSGVCPLKTAFRMFLVVRGRNPEETAFSLELPPVPGGRRAALASAGRRQLLARPAPRHLGPVHVCFITVCLQACPRPGHQQGGSVRTDSSTRVWWSPLRGPKPCGLNEGLPQARGCSLPSSTRVS